MWYERLLLYSATKEFQLWFWVEHLTPWGWRLLYQPAGGQVLEPTLPISWALPSGGWTRSGYVLHIFCSWDGNQDSPNMFCGSSAKLTKKTCGKQSLVGKQPANAPWRHKRDVCSNPLVWSSEGDVTFWKCLWQSKKKSVEFQRCCKPEISRHVKALFSGKTGKISENIQHRAKYSQHFKCFALQTAWVCPQKELHPVVRNPCMDSMSSKPHFRAMLTLKQTQRRCSQLRGKKGYSCISVIVQH